MSKHLSTLRVDPIACDGHGLCAELFPERISTDDWGYPLIDPTPIPASLEAHARRAVSECPKCALRLVAAAPAADRDDAGASTGRRRGRTRSASAPGV